MSEPEGDDASTTAGEDAEPESRRTAVLLDVLPSGKPGDDRPQYQKSPVAYALGVDGFGLYELTLVEDASPSVGTRVTLEPREARELVTRYRVIDHDDLTNTAANELEYAVEDVVDSDETRFVDFFNEAGPITLRLHQLNLLPGIGKKLRNNILDERKRGPFESFEGLSERVSGLHSPKEVVVERIIEEIREEDLKYKTFVGRGEETV